MRFTGWVLLAFDLFMSTLSLDRFKSSVRQRDAIRFLNLCALDLLYDCTLADYIIEKYRHWFGKGGCA